VTVESIDTRVVVYSAIGAALYGVFSWVTNILALPSVSNVSLRPAIVIPVFFGFAFGPVVGFFTGFVGNVLGDALTGWGVYPVWDVGNGLIGLICGLVLAFSNRKQALDVLTWITVIVSIIATGLVFTNPTAIDPFSGKEGDFSGFWWIPLAGAVLVLLARYVLASRNVDLAAIAVWGTLAIVIGIGFSSLLDIYVNGYSFITAFVGEFVPAGGSEILNAVILAPILLGAWTAARAQMGR
jgi:energy-coupling factor transport system substrate-specific component